MEKQQKYLVIGAAIVLVVLLLICCFVGEKNNTETSEDAEKIVATAQKESDAISEDEKKELTQIDMDTYLEYYNGSEEKLVLFARPTCSYCKIAEPIIQNIAYKYNFEIYYVNTDELADDEQEKLINSNTYFSEGYGTPLLLIVKDGEIVDKIDGLTDTEHYLDFFEYYGYVS